MIVYDLRCEAGHRFEGWFGDAADFERQAQQGLLACPVCEARTIERVPTPARINKGASPPAPPSPATPPQTAAALRTLRDLMERHSEDVGTRFAEEARRIHYGETEERAIRGQASVGEVRELVEEGVPVLPLPPKPEKLN